jgi:predicted protein tyrosine phosphatase
MQNLLISPTVCGLEELSAHGSRRSTHVLSLLDPGAPRPESLASYPPHHGLTLHFHDEIEPGPGIILPQPNDIKAILDFGMSLCDHVRSRQAAHVLVHCHMGVSRSTAATGILLAQLHPEMNEADIFAEVLRIRPQAWPNRLMVYHADNALKRGGRLTAAVSQLYATRIASNPALGRFMRENGRASEVEMAESFLNTRKP